MSRARTQGSSSSRSSDRARARQEGRLSPMEASTACDRFGDRADEYARYRPTYPDGLFDHLERLVRARELAWDCGAGSGQTARSLARRFARVLATDTSLRQLTRAGAH